MVVGKTDNSNCKFDRIAVIAGSSGFLGGHLTATLRRSGWRVRPLVRRTPNAQADEIEWDPSAGKIDASSLEGVTAVVHLGGVPIAAKRWSAEHKTAIYSSRIDSTRLLADTLVQLNRKPSVFVCASATGYYGNRGDEPIDETSSAGSDFLATVARDWESATTPASDAGIRVVNVRTGMVLSKEGGALRAMLQSFRCGLGGVLGNGQQYISWISLVDWVRLVMFLMDCNEAVGPFNATAPQPVTNHEFTKVLGKTLHRPTICRVSALMLRMVFGELADAVLLGGSYVLPKKAESLGFVFEHMRLESALKNTLQRR